MRLNSRLALAAAVAVGALALNPAAALAHDGGHGRHGHNLIKADLTPSKPTDPPIFEVGPGGLPWVLDKGEVRVREDGRTDVRLEGLQILRADGSTDNPVTLITASLYCGGQLAARSAQQPLSVPEGDARFRVWLAVPQTCDMATVLINPPPNAKTGQFAYIASAMATPDDDQDDD
ncbi:MAG: hypothetical protein QOI54_3211 [Actinomycetota bacterium]|nr:hypothetical protein [Actinomycetota bacterium]